MPIKYFFAKYVCTPLVMFILGHMVGIMLYAKYVQYILQYIVPHFLFQSFDIFKIEARGRLREIVFMYIQHSDDIVKIYPLSKI